MLTTALGFVLLLGAAPFCAERVRSTVTDTDVAEYEHSAMLWTVLAALSIVSGVWLMFFTP